MNRYFYIIFIKIMNRKYDFALNINTLNIRLYLFIFLTFYLA